MAYTNKEIVRKHLVDHQIGIEEIHNEPLQLNGIDYTYLQKRGIVSGSEKLKAKEIIEPITSAVEFIGSDSYSLAHKNLIPETIVVANDSSLGKIYIENVDYGIDYDNGIIKRNDSGSIAVGSNVTIWYLYFHVYQKGVDYDIDYDNGSVRRRSSSTIESGQWVWVDYTPRYGAIDDEAIQNAIDEADGFVLAAIDSKFADSNDRLLVIAETYLAVSIICLVKSISTSANALASNTEAQVKSLISLSELYRREALELLSRFAVQINTLNSPSRA